MARKLWVEDKGALDRQVAGDGALADDGQRPPQGGVEQEMSENTPIVASLYTRRA